MNKVLYLVIIFLVGCLQEIPIVEENADPAKISFITAKNITDQSAMISFGLNSNANGYIEYGETSNFGLNSLSSLALKTEHQIYLVNLNSDSLYYYRLVLMDKNLNRIVSQTLSFKTLKKEVIPPVVSAPKVLNQMVQTEISNAVISIDTDQDVRIKLEYGLTDSLGMIVNSNDFKKSHSLTLGNLQDDSSYFYKLTITSAGNKSTESSVQSFETKKIPGTAPVIISQPKDQTVSQGDMTTISVEATGVESYQWEVLIKGEFIIPNTTQLEKTLSLKTTKWDDGSTWRCVLTNKFGKTYSNAAKITVKPELEPEPSPPVVDNGGELKAFPTAHGFGRNATGGRGGRVIAVTNLNSSGSGSLREALTASGIRTIIFRVSGTINITSTIYVRNGNFSIAGETAPGQGIQIVGSNGAWIQIEASNVIIRHLKFRGNTGAAQSSLRFIASGSSYSDIIIDHCSFSWANPDEMAISFEGSGTGNIPQISNVTVSNSIFGELYRGILQYKGHNNFSYYRNYFYSVYQRTPEANRPIYQKANTLSFEAINQLWHNNFHFTLQAQFGSRVTAIGNKRTGVSGVANPSGIELIDFNIGAGPSEGVLANSYLYAKDNINTIAGLYDGTTASYLKSTPYTTSDIKGNLIIPAANINSILPVIGAFHWDRDSVDTRFINHYLNSNGGRGPYTGTPPALKNGSAYTDSDGDGISDEWEIKRGLNPHSADNNDDDDNDGYTNLEEFLHFLAKDF